MENVKKFVTMLLCVATLVCLSGCTEPTPEELGHNHEIKEVTTQDVVGYAWEREYYRLWHNFSLLGTDTRGTYLEVTHFNEIVSFLTKHTVNEEEVTAVISFEIDDVDTYANIMSHLYEPFDIQIDYITYTDGCTTKQFRLIGLHEEQSENGDTTEDEHTNK